MSGLLKLPVDALLPITEHLDVRSFVRFCSTCKRLFTDLMKHKVAWHPAARQLLDEEPPTHVKPLAEWSLDELQLSVTRSGRMMHALWEGFLPVFPCSEFNLGFIPGKQITLLEKEGDSLLLPGGRLLIGVFEFEDSVYFAVWDVASPPIDGLLLPIGSQRLAECVYEELELIPQYEAKHSIVVLVFARSPDYCFHIMTTRAVNDQWNSAEVRQAACFTVPEAQLDCYRISALYGAYVIVDFQYHALVWNWKDNHWAFYRKKGDETICWTNGKNFATFNTGNKFTVYQIYGVSTHQFHQLAAIPTGLVTQLELKLMSTFIKKRKLTIPSWTSIQKPTTIFMTYPSDRYAYWCGAGICVEDRTIDAENNGADSNIGISLKHHFAFSGKMVATRWRVSGVEGTITLFDRSTDLVIEATRLIGISGVISNDDLKDAWHPVSKYRIGELIGVCWYSGRFLTHADDEDQPYKLWSFDSRGSVMQERLHNRFE